MLTSLLATEIAQRNEQLDVIEYALAGNDDPRILYVVHRTRLNRAVNAITEDDPTDWWEWKDGC